MFQGEAVPKFTDTIIIRVKAGNGGPGAVSFFREKYVPKGGPDGGDGGRGGDLFIEADYNFYNLSHYFRDRVYSAENGERGRGGNQHGADGGDLTLKVPPGTVVLDEDGEVIGDLLHSGDRVKVCQGGIGGKGNAFFKSSTFQTPRFAQPGMPGEEKRVVLNLKLIADIGLVGLPNAGKSTLLSVLTNAKPKIADYPFTTLTPNLGVVARGDGPSYKIADIPGIIEGAHMGHGLGLSFLRHIERVKIILFLIDPSVEDPAYNLELLRGELREYSPVLLEKPYHIVLTKSDLVDDGEMERRAASLGGEKVLAISATTGHNIDRLYEIIDSLLETAGASS